jgi:redox-sensitive bicupin YhaK (pirin superfamily)
MPAKSIQKVVRDVPGHWVGDGFPVRSMFAYEDSERYDPFLLLDYAAPYTFAPSSAPRGVGEHPHRGFETVTIVYQGELEHRDSAGNHGSIGPGDVQWMTAAGGVVHEEFHSHQFTRTGGVFEVVQLWVNLPASDKMSPPRYQGILDNQIPVVQVSGELGRVRVIAGEFQGVKGPARTFTPIHLWDVQLKAGASAELPVPDGFTTALVIQRGTATISGSETVSAPALVLFDRQGDSIAVECQDDFRALLLSGQPLNEPVAAQGPFVMNTREQIREAILDFQAGRMGRLA